MVYFLKRQASKEQSSDDFLPLIALVKKKNNIGPPRCIMIYTFLSTYTTSGTHSVTQFTNKNKKDTNYAKTKYAEQENKLNK